MPSIEAQLFKMRSRASRKGHTRKRVRQAGYNMLEPFIQARESGADWRTIHSAHAAWIEAQKTFREVAGSRDEWRFILEQIGDAMDLDDDFVAALLESPETDGS